MTRERSCRAGVGLRPDHYPHLSARPRTAVRWFEAISARPAVERGMAVPKT